MEGRRMGKSVEPRRNEQQKGRMCDRRSGIRVVGPVERQMDPMTAAGPDKEVPHCDTRWPLSLRLWDQVGACKHLAAVTAHLSPQEEAALAFEMPQQAPQTGGGRH